MPETVIRIEQTDLATFSAALAPAVQLLTSVAEGIAMLADMLRAIDGRLAALESQGAAPVMIRVPGPPLVLDTSLRTPAREATLRTYWSKRHAPRAIIFQLNNLEGPPWPPGDYGANLLQAWVDELGLPRGHAQTDPFQPPPPTTGGADAPAPQGDSSPPVAPPPAATPDAARPMPGRYPRCQKANWPEIENWAASRGMAVDSDLETINALRVKAGFMPFALAEAGHTRPAKAN